jgi:hypothetical protein
MVVGVHLIAVWVAAAAGGRAARPVRGAELPALAQDQAVGDAHMSLRAATERLEAHARRPSGAVAAVRDPFRFGGAARLAARPGSARPGVEPSGGAAPAAEALPLEIVLQGIAESIAGDTVVRTAILNAGGELVLATIGSHISGRYQVVAIAGDSMELEDLIDHGRRTWRMK